MKTSIVKVLALKERDFGFASYIVRVNNSLMDASKKNKDKYFRREAVLIVNPENDTRILRYVVGNPGTMSLTKSTIGLDYDGLDSLGIKFRDKVNLIVTKATRFEVYRWYMNHQDLNVRISMRLGVLGAVLGIIGFIMGFIPVMSL